MFNNTTFYIMNVIKYHKIMELPETHPVVVFSSEWQKLLAKAQGEQWPSRLAFRPFNQPRVLEWLMLVEAVQQNGLTRFYARVAGTGLESLFGMRLTGLEYAQWLTADDRKVRYAEINRMEEEASPLFSLVSSAHAIPHNRHFYRGLFPLGDGNRLTHFILVMAPKGQKIFMGAKEPPVQSTKRSWPHPVDLSASG